MFAGQEAYFSNLLVIKEIIIIIRYIERSRFDFTVIIESILLHGCRTVYCLCMNVSIIILVNK